MLRLFWIALGAVMVAAGVVWTLQGFNVIGGSFMSGHAVYAVLGIVVGVIGLALVGLGLRRRAPAV